MPPHHLERTPPFPSSLLEDSMPALTCREDSTCFPLLQETLPEDPPGQLHRPREMYPHYLICLCFGANVLLPPTSLSIMKPVGLAW